MSTSSFWWFRVCPVTHFGFDFDFDRKMLKSSGISISLHPPHTHYTHHKKQPSQNPKLSIELSKNGSQERISLKIFGSGHMIAYKCWTFGRGEVTMSLLYITCDITLVTGQIPLAEDKNSEALFQPEVGRCHNRKATKRENRWPRETGRRGLWWWGRSSSDGLCQGLGGISSLRQVIQSKPTISRIFGTVVFVLHCTVIHSPCNTAKYFYLNLSRILPNKKKLPSSCRLTDSTTLLHSA